MQDQVLREHTPVRRAAIPRRADLIRLIGSLALIGAAAWAIVASRTAADMAATLVVIGFDPDRARLITGLTLEATLVSLGTVVFASSPAAVLGGAIVFAAYFRRTFLHETRDALSASGAQGTFDPAGWALTLVTLATIVLVVGGSAAALARIVRRHLLAAGADVRAVIRGDRAIARLRAPAIVLLATGLLAVTLPVFGDMVNYEPDAHMRHGTASGPSLTAEGPSVQVAAGLPPVSTALLDGGGLSGGGVGAGSVLSTARPWLAWRPSGAGTIANISLPAPWSGNPPPRTDVAVYLPPGYATSSIRYPVLYTAPFGLTSWQAYVQLPAMLDSLIDSGAIPATIVVFASEHGGPYPDSECANSVDGREWFEDWIVKTVVPTIDQTYRTVPRASARALMGFSQGGYCAPMLTLRHPDVFGAAISFSGYFQAGVRSGQTPNAWLPYGGNAAVEAKASPLLTVGRLPVAVRSALFFELSAGPTQPFYGPQYAAFARVLEAARVPFELFPTSLGHAWSATRLQLPAMLEALAARQVALGVFSA